MILRMSIVYGIKGEDKDLGDIRRQYKWDERERERERVIVHLLLHLLFVTWTFILYRY